MKTKDAKTFIESLGFESQYEQNTQYRTIYKKGKNCIVLAASVIDRYNFYRLDLYVDSVYSCYHLHDNGSDPYNKEATKLNCLEDIIYFIK